MEQLDNFNVVDGKIHLNTHEIVIRRYKNADKDAYTDNVYYADAERVTELETNIVPKHQLMEILSKTELNNEQYAYMEGIVLRTQDFGKEIEEIAGYGSLEAYEASLPEATDSFKLDTDYRLSKLELGL